jgi:hypothetical protein
MSLKIKFETFKEKILSCPDTRKEYEDLALEYDQWERLDKLAKEMNLGKFDWDEWKSYRDEGRK